MYNMREDERVVHVVLHCDKYNKDRMEIMQIILTILRCEINMVVERTGK